MIGVAILFILLGILVKHGKMYNLLAGYNTLSREGKAKIEIRGLATLFRNTMPGMALVMILGHFATHWHKDPALGDFAFFGALLIGIPYLLLKANSKKFKKQP